MNVRVEWREQELFHLRRVNGAVARMTPKWESTSGTSYKNPLGSKTTKIRGSRKDRLPEEEKGNGAQKEKAPS